MQGIYQGFDLYTHDITWTCLLDIVERDGSSTIMDIYKILEDNKCRGRNYEYISHNRIIDSSLLGSNQTNE